MKKSFDIAVTGATGHLGRVLVPMLLSQGHRVRCLARGNAPDDWNETVDWVQGDLCSPDQAFEFVRDREVVIHCASLISVGGKNEEEMYKVNVEATESLVKACVKFRVKLIYISSSTATCDPAIGAELREDSPLREDKRFYYAWTKAQAERIIKKAISEDRLEGFILRPTALVGPPDHRPSRFGKVIWNMHLGKVWVLPEGGYNLLDIRDFAKAVVNSLVKGQNGEVYLTGGSYQSLKALSLMANPDKTVFTVPISLLQGLLPLIGILKILVPSLQEMNRESLLTLKLAPRLVDSSKAQKILGLKTRPLKESVDDLITWMKNRSE